MESIAQVPADPDHNVIDLSGQWFFQIDSLDKGETEKWYNKSLTDNVLLPGSMTSNGKGNEIDVNTPWTGSIVDSSWFVSPAYVKYREKGNIKVPFWLQPDKYYKGAAWYQKTIRVPASWENKHIEFFVERSHWENKVWVDGRYVETKNALGTPDVFDLTQFLAPGEHNITVRIDNRINDIDVGQNSHSISDHTQSNWNGMIGKIFLSAHAQTFIDDVQLFPDIHKNQVVAHIRIKSDYPRKINLLLSAQTDSHGAQQLKTVEKTFYLQAKDSVFEIVYNMGEHPLLWDEFHPDIYALKIQLRSNNGTDERKVIFGMREFSSEGTQFTVNGRKTFLRGTLECAIFPKTGYPPTDLGSWIYIFQRAKSYGLNHIRFHSWCPPEAAFEAADRTGFYLQIECSSWANQGATIGDEKSLDTFIYEESKRIARSFGNHPSFCMMAYGNEPAGRNHKDYLKAFVNYWKQNDNRRLYTTAAGWPVVPENNYNSTPEPRIQAWGEGLKSIINNEPPKSDYDWAPAISKWQHPTVSHEIGQWCVYPDFKEIKKYTGVLKAKNFEIFQEKLREHGMGNLADSFLLASGKLQALCYKADIEAALRTKGMGGFQLLDLHDFPGQGTALVGVLNPFWEDKGYITAKQYSEFCNAIVPLARFPKMIYTSAEILSVVVEIAQFGEKGLKNIAPTWSIKDQSGKEVFSGQFSRMDIPVGNGFQLGAIKQKLTSIEKPVRLTLTVSVNDYHNSWDFFVYPAVLSNPDKDIMIAQELTGEAIQKLKEGGKVLLTLKKGSIKKTNGGDIAVGFSSIFWNTAWTNNQPPHTLGILCNPAHPAFEYFPTEYYSNWQWWDAMRHSDAVILDSIAKNLQPIVRVIDDWVTARPLGLLFECKTGNGKLLFSSIDLMSEIEIRPEAKQLTYSLLKYMESDRFNPDIKVDISKLQNL